MATQDIDTRSDIFSLGVVLYELLAGVLPFEHESFERAGFAEIQRTIRELEPASPSIRLTHLGEKAKTIAASRGTQVIALARRLHRELEWIPLKAMRKDRCRRYRSASELADDVRNYLNGLPLIAGPETATYRVRKFVHKHAGSVATVALVAVAIILGLVISTVMYFRAEQARKQEAVARTRAEQAENVAEQQRKLAEDRAEELRRTLYVNTIQLADAKHREGNARQVRELLDSCPEDLRGWEWNRLSYTLDLSLRTLHASSSSDNFSVALRTDGKYIVSGGFGKTIKVWDTATGEQMLTIPDAHGGDVVTCVAFSPDGKQIVSADDLGEITIWDAARGNKRMQLAKAGHSADAVALSGHSVDALAFSPDGKTVAAGTIDGAVLWESGMPAGGYEARRNAQIARGFVERLYSKCGFYRDVISELQSDAKIDPDIRRIALNIANSRKWEDADKLEDEAWENVRSPDKDISAYRMAFEKSKKAAAWEPNDPAILTMLGASQYRVGSYDNALETLAVAQQILSEAGEEPDPWNLAFEVMSLHKIGRAEEATAALERLRELCKDEQFAQDLEVQALLAEAEKLLAGENQ